MNIERRKAFEAWMTARDREFTNWQLWQAAVETERKRCLEICEQYYTIEQIAQDIAAEIRGSQQ